MVVDVPLNSAPAAGARHGCGINDRRRSYLSSTSPVCGPALSTWHSVRGTQYAALGQLRDDDLVEGDKEEIVNGRLNVTADACWLSLAGGTA